MAPRSKNVVVGGREFIVRPLLGKVAREISTSTVTNGVDSMVQMVAAALRRTAPDITEEWLLEHGDMSEFNDVIDAVKEVTASPKTQGEAPAP